MSFRPEILTSDVLAAMAARLSVLLGAPLPEAEAALAGTLGYASWEALLAASAAPSPALWLSVAANRKLLWKLLAMYMRMGVAIFDAIGEIRRSLIQSGHGPDMVSALDYIQKLTVEGDLGPGVARAIAPFDQDEATRFYITSRCSSFDTALAKMAE